MTYLTLDQFLPNIYFDYHKLYMHENKFGSAKINPYILAKSNPKNLLNFFTNKQLQRFLIHVLKDEVIFHSLTYIRGT